MPPRAKSGIVGGLAPAALDERVAIVGTSGSGKALALDTPLPTPSGWTTMGEVKIGDQLLDEQGQPCRVTFVTEVQHGRDCFEVRFSDGTTVVADADHVWLTESYNSRIADSNAKRPEKRVNAGRGRVSRPQCQRRMYPSLVTTTEISKTLTAVKGGMLERNHAVRNCLPITLPEAELMIPPYVLGCWLGDGTAQSALLTTADSEVLAEIQREGFAVGEPVQQKVGRNCAQYRIGSGPHGRKLATLLREQNLALNKHVPAAYLRGSVQQRLDLLAGLMDTDGTVAKGSNSCVFYNTRPALADAVFELAASLGWNPRITTKIGRLNGVDHSVCYTVRFRPNRQVFRLARKASLLNFEVSQAARYGHRMIDAVTPVPSVPVKCIAVDSANHLFLCTRSFVPTHNTYAAKGLVELLLTSAARICVVDPLGVWWGLRSSADGITPGFPVIVFGGRHADVPLDEGMGAALGRVVGKHESLACVVDVSELGSSAARRRFMSAFAESLYESNTEPLHLVMDEADLWSPQRPLPEANALLGRIEEIVRRGRVRGFIPWLITQRPAVVHKDVLSQADILICMKLTSSQDRDAIGGWIEGQADRAEGKRILGELPRLQRGEGFLWAPSDGVLTRVAFPKIRTFDSSRTPRRGERIATPRTLADVDLSAIVAALAATNTEKEAHERKPPRDHRRVAILERDIAAARDRVTAIENENRELRAQLDAIGKIIQAPSSNGALVKATVNLVADLGIDGPPRVTPKARTNRPDALAASDDLHRAARKLLAALAQHAPARFTWGQAATLAGLKPSGGHFNAGRKALRDAGYIEETVDLVSVSAAGLEAAGEVPPAPSTATERLAMWCGRLPSPAPDMLRTLAAKGEQFTETDDLAATLGKKPSGGHWNSGIAVLRNNGLIEVDGRKLRAAVLLR